VVDTPGRRYHLPSTTPLVVAKRFSAKALWLDPVFMVASVVLAAFSCVTVTVAKPGTVHR